MSVVTEPLTRAENIRIEPDTFPEAQQLTQEECTAWESKIDALRQDCGCKWGAWSLLAITTLYYFHLWWVPAEFGLGFWVRAVLGVPVAFIAAGIGKAIGLMVARLKLKRAIARLSQLTADNTGG